MGKITFIHKVLSECKGEENLSLPNLVLVDNLLPLLSPGKHSKTKEKICYSPALKLMW